MATKHELRVLSQALLEPLSTDPVTELRAIIAVDEFTIKKMHEDLPRGKTTLLLEDAKRRLTNDKRRLRRLERQHEQKQGGPGRSSPAKRQVCPRGLRLRKGRPTL